MCSLGFREFLNKPTREGSDTLNSTHFRHKLQPTESAMEHVLCHHLKWWHSTCSMAVHGADLHTKGQDICDTFSGYACPETRKLCSPQMALVSPGDISLLSAASPLVGFCPISAVSLYAQPYWSVTRRCHLLLSWHHGNQLPATLTAHLQHRLVILSLRKSHEKVRALLKSVPQ